MLSYFTRGSLRRRGCWEVLRRPACHAPDKRLEFAAFLGEAVFDARGFFGVAATAQKFAFDKLVEAFGECSCANAGNGVFKIAKAVARRIARLLQDGEGIPVAENSKKWR